MSFLARLPMLWKGKAAEGKYRPGPWLTSDGVIAASWGRYANFWQAGYNPRPFSERGAMVEACVSAYSQTCAMCPGDHWRKLANGGRERVSTSALSRIMKRPNDYQSISDFMMNLTRLLYERGEGFALAIRNSRFEIVELHLMRQGSPVIGNDGSIFYQLSGNEIVEQRFDIADPIPARDVLHVRLHTPQHWLKGVSPILAATLEMAMSGAVLNQQVAFYLNAARPSYILETELKLSEKETEELRARWNAQTQGENSGSTPILGWGIKAHPVTATAQDGQLAELLRMSDQGIALALRIPLQILGIGGTPYASTELLMQSWIATGLGFTLNHIEEALGQMFGLRGVPDEYLEFDTRALLRSAYRERMEGLARAVISGIMSSDEARGSEDLPATPGGVGAEPRVQMQVVPLSYGANLQPPPLQETLPAPPSGGDNTADDTAQDDTADRNAETARALSVFRAHARYAA